MTYNLQGKRTSLENLAGQVTTTARDCCHKVSEPQPDGSATTWDYDAEGRMIAASRLILLDMTNVTWLTTCYKYDDLGRQTATWPTNYATQVYRAEGSLSGDTTSSYSHEVVSPNAVVSTRYVIIFLMTVRSLKLQLKISVYHCCSALKLELFIQSS